MFFQSFLRSLGLPRGLDLMDLGGSGMNLGWIWDESMSPSGVPKGDSERIPGILAFA